MSNGTLNQNLLTYIFSKIKTWGFPKSGGTITGDVTLDNSSSSQKNEPSLNWGTVGGNKPYVGFAHDQSDGTFVICSMEKDTTTNGGNSSKRLKTASNSGSSTYDYTIPEGITRATVTVQWTSSSEECNSYIYIYDY